MRKFYLSLFLLLTIMVGCNTSNDYLSGETFNLAYIPSPDSDQNVLENHQPFMTLNFEDGTVTREDGNQITGEYTLTDNKLVITFVNEKEELRVEFEKLMESEKEFSSYSTEISNVEPTEESEDIFHLANTRDKFSADLPIEFIKE